ncbi:hypothetical protein G5I_02987 [Acromyrmex echinatior]|uniref:Uncharacterized protein n=1 Tax=Acromyrmex echinatior TaxID=103372 RepID=F4WBR6_ACREC|nr:hypothetical protein G5I_02987 [Acromyrmex echinatior]
MAIKRQHAAQEQMKKTCAKHRSISNAVLSIDKLITTRSYANGQIIAVRGIPMVSRATRIADKPACSRAAAEDTHSWITVWVRNESFERYVFHKLKRIHLFALTRWVRIHLQTTCTFVWQIREE